MDPKNPNKYASEYPLPGGVERYFDTLVALLRHIRDNDVAPDDLSKWMFDPERIRTNRGEWLYRDTQSFEPLVATGQVHSANARGHNPCRQS
jgi:hypothetical protein